MQILTEKRGRGAADSLTSVSCWRLSRPSLSRAITRPRGRAPDSTAAIAESCEQSESGQVLPSLCAALWSAAGREAAASHPPAVRHGGESGRRPSGSGTAAYRYLAMPRHCTMSGKAENTISRQLSAARLERRNPAANRSAKTPASKARADSSAFPWQGGRAARLGCLGLPRANSQRRVFRLGDPAQSLKRRNRGKH